jgi:hypothetical protein
MTTPDIPPGIASADGSIVGNLSARCHGASGFSPDEPEMQPNSLAVRPICLDTVKRRSDAAATVLSIARREAQHWTTQVVYARIRALFPDATGFYLDVSETTALQSGSTRSWRCKLESGSSCTGAPIVATAHSPTSARSKRWWACC